MRNEAIIKHSLEQGAEIFNSWDTKYEIISGPHGWDRVEVAEESLCPGTMSLRKSSSSR